MLGARSHRTAQAKQAHELSKTSVPIEHKTPLSLTLANFVRAIAKGIRWDCCIL